ncbi:hypothetical protein [Ornithinibacillus scapharcae]|uniref:hypothetical protein n=1 Tax=Ornithinibacillus scapharcae TaxID=1147159 RepID=UPI000225BAC6|nr:hypothetical protein [Ornithinibacillus scapharcae]
MLNLSHEEVIKELKEILKEDITNRFEEELSNAGEHGEPSFMVENREGKAVEVFVEWDKEADQLFYSIEEV